MSERLAFICRILRLANDEKVWRVHSDHFIRIILRDLIWGREQTRFGRKFSNFLGELYEEGPFEFAERFGPNILSRS